tara:strand:+ start:1758 stop:2117 length:360 start_codon:yes stop_codon:yes gene_type:complete
MKQFEVSYDVGPHLSREFLVDAVDKKSARKMAAGAMEYDPSAKFNWIKELKPISRVKYEADIYAKDLEIDRLTNGLVTFPLNHQIISTIVPIKILPNKLLNEITSSIDDYRRARGWNGD